VKGTLVGIDEKRKGYKCYILEWKKMVTSRDIIIEEEKNLTHHVDVGSNEDVVDESEVKIGGSIFFLQIGTQTIKRSNKFIIITLASCSLKIKT
jgi:hypothetical protein